MFFTTKWHLLRRNSDAVQGRPDGLGMGGERLGRRHFAGVRPQCDAGPARQDMHMGMENDLPAGIFIELLDGQAIGLHGELDRPRHALDRQNEPLQGTGIDVEDLSAYIGDDLGL